MGATVEIAAVDKQKRQLMCMLQTDSHNGYTIIRASSEVGIYEGFEGSQNQHERRILIKPEHLLELDSTFVEHQSKRLLSLLHMQVMVQGEDDEGEECDYELSDESVEESENDEDHEAKKPKLFHALSKVAEASRDGTSPGFSCVDFSSLLISEPSRFFPAFPVVGTLAHVANMHVEVWGLKVYMFQASGVIAYLATCTFREEEEDEEEKEEEEEEEEEGRGSRLAVSKSPTIETHDCKPFHDKQPVSLSAESMSYNELQWDLTFSQGLILYQELCPSYRPHENCCRVCKLTNDPLSTRISRLCPKAPSHHSLKLRRQRKLSQHQLRKMRHVGSEEPCVSSTTKLKRRKS
eukprot:1161355-Pelagomonas_calceolata.AAC.1